jgi:cytochrome P450
LFLHLAQNPEIQEKLREEVFASLPDDEESISMETIEKMEYLNAVVKETLRYQIVTLFILC